MADINAITRFLRKYSNAVSRLINSLIRFCGSTNPDHRTGRHQRLFYGLTKEENLATGKGKVAIKNKHENDGRSPRIGRSRDRIVVIITYHSTILY